MESNVIDKVEQVRPTTESSILYIQKHLIPSFIELYPEIVWDAYYISGNRYTITANFQFGMIVHNLPYNDDVINKREEPYFIDSLENMVNRNEIRPMFIFVDNVFINWSRIKIVHDINTSYILIEYIDFEKVDTLKCLSFPFNIEYIEDDIIDSDENTIVFSDGLKSNTGDVSIRSNDPCMFIQVQETDDVFYKTQLNNFSNVYSTDKNNYCLIFKDGLLYPDAKLDIDDYGLFTIDDGIKGDYSRLTVVFFYHIATNINEHSYLFKVSDVIDKIGFDERLINKLDFSYSIDNLYETNLDNALNSILSYDTSIMDTIYDELSDIETVEYTGLEFIRLSKLGYVNFNENSKCYETDNSTYLIRRRPMIFVNNLLYDNHRGVYIQDNVIKVPVNNIKVSDKIEVLWFKEVINETYAHSHADIQDSIMNEITTEEVIDELTTLKTSNLEIYTSANPINAEIKMTSVDDLDRVQFKIDYDSILGGDNHIGFHINSKPDLHGDIKEYEGTIPLTLVSKRQFRYFGFIANRIGFNFQLSSDFNYCLNKNQYFIFVNGKKISQENFILISASMKQPFDDISIYMTTEFNPGDYIDIFYLPLITSEVIHAPRIPKSGMINLRKERFKYGLSRDRYLVFLNGEKIFKSQMNDINSHKFYINTDMQSRNDMYIIGHIHSQKDLFNKFHIESQWDSITDHLDSSELKQLLDLADIEQTDVKDDFNAWKIDDLEITSEIARDYWLSSRIYRDHHDYIYDYNDIALGEKDFYEAKVNKLLNAYPEYKRLYETFDYDIKEDELDNSVYNGLDIDDIEDLLYDEELLNHIIENANAIRALSLLLDVDIKNRNERILTLDNINDFLRGLNYFKIKELSDNNTKNLVTLYNDSDTPISFTDYENDNDDFRIDYINLKLQVLQDMKYIEELEDIIEVDYNYLKLCNQTIENYNDIVRLYTDLKVDIPESIDNTIYTDDESIIKSYIDLNNRNIRYLVNKLDNVYIKYSSLEYEINDNYDINIDNFNSQVNQITDCIKTIKTVLRRKGICLN